MDQLYKLGLRVRVSAGHQPASSARSAAQSDGREDHEGGVGAVDERRGEGAARGLAQGRARPDVLHVG